jgi:hypothetical protein
MKRRIALTLVSAGFLMSAAWAAAKAGVPEKAEVVFSDDFEDGRADHWRGGKALSGRLIDTKGALATTAGDLILTRSVSFQATERTYLTFRYWANGCHSLGVQFNDKTRGDNFKTFITPLRQKGWTAVRFNIAADIQGCSNHTAGISPGDTLVNVLIWPMEKLPGAKLLIDDVAIYTMGEAARRAQISAPPGGQDHPLPVLEAKAAEDAARIARAELAREMQKAHSLAECDYVVGIESPLVRVSDRNERMPFRGRIGKAVEIAAAAREYENVQLIVIPTAKDLEKVTVTLTDLVGPGGKIDKKNLEWRLAEDVRTKPSYGYPRSLHGWKPDPLLPGEPFDVKVKQMKAVWVTTFVPPEAGPGEYSGTITLAPANSHPVRVGLKLHVWNYALPLRGRFRHMCHFQPQQAFERGGSRLGPPSPEKRRENYGFLLKYRFSPTAQYSRSPSPQAEDIQFCLDRGITTFVAGNHPGPKVNVDAVRPYYEALKKAGCLDLAVIYIGDEGTSPEKLAEYRRKAVTVKRNFPGLRVMVGGSTPRKELIGFVDVWDPIMSMTAGRGQGYQFNRQAVEERKALGEEVLWYMAGVRPPYPSIELDPPATSIRMFCWITWKYGVGGWELYGTQGGWDKPTSKTWPKTEWDTYTWRTYNGSGQFVYPGPDGVPLASIRLENARDGIEDYESLALLAEAIELARTGKGRVDSSLRAEAEKILAIRPEIVTDMWEWTRDPRKIATARAEVSRTLDQMVSALGREAFDEFVAARAEARRKADNEAYDRRLKAFLASHAGQDEQK